MDPLYWFCKHPLQEIVQHQLRTNQNQQKQHRSLIILNVWSHPKYLYDTNTSFKTSHKHYSAFQIESPDDRVKEEELIKLTKEEEASIEKEARDLRYQGFDFDKQV